jgi:hypothetical protein
MLEYDSASKKKEILSFVTTCVNLEDIKQNKPNAETDVTLSHFYMNLKSQTYRNRAVPGSRVGMGKRNSDQSFWSLKVTEEQDFWDLLHRLGIVLNNNLLCTWKVLRE